MDEGNILPGLFSRIDDTSNEARFASVVALSAANLPGESGSPEPKPLEELKHLRRMRLAPRDYRKSRYDWCISGRRRERAPRLRSRSSLARRDRRQLFPITPFYSTPTATDPICSSISPLTPSIFLHLPHIHQNGQGQLLRR